MMTCNDQEIHGVMMTNFAQKSQRFIQETFLEDTWKSIITFKGQDMQTIDQFKICCISHCRQEGLREGVFSCWLLTHAPACKDLCC